MTDSYDQARQVADAVQAQPFVLPAYTGGIQDLGYLKQWVLSLVTALYSVPASVFDEPTVYSTSILRDFVHRALMDTTAPWSEPDQFPTFLGWNDVGVEFRGPAHGLCGDMAWQEWEVFRAFGYQTAEISTINSTPDAFTDGHQMTEVYVADLGKYIVQDDTFNFAYQDTSGNFLDFNQARQDARNGTLVFNGYHDYRLYSETGSYETEIPVSDQTYLAANYLNNVYWWWDSNGNQIDIITKLFPSYQTAHSASSFQGAEFASLAAAQTALSNLTGQGENWQAAAATLRGEGYYVSGFELTDASGNPTSQWLTFRLSDGTYESVSMTGSVLNGSFDQLENEATNGISSGPALNPGADLSAFVHPLYILGSDGTLMNTGVANLAPIDLPHADFLNASRSDYLIENTTGALEVGQVGSGGQVAYGNATALGAWQLVGTGNFLGDVHDQFLIENAGGALYFGQVGTDGAVTYHSFSALSAGWRVVGTGNYLDHGQDQFLIENASGAVSIGQLGSTGQAVYSSYAALGAWTLVGTGDYLGLGYDQFLIENAGGLLYTGQVGSNGQAVYHSFAALSAGWTLVGSGDYLGLGHDQFLIANASGAVDIGQVGSGQQATIQSFASLGAGWTFEGSGDYLGEGHDQFLIENASGVVQIGDYTGGQVHLTQVSTLASQWTIHG